MAQLTEAYLKKLIRQVLKENQGKDIAGAVEQWRIDSDSTLQEFAAEQGADFGGVTAEEMEMYLKAEKQRAKKAGIGSFDYNKL